MRDKKRLLFFSMFVFSSFSVSAQVDTCWCEKLSGGCQERPEDAITEVVEIRPACSGRPAVYQQVTRWVLKSPCDDRIIRYPCDCKEKAKKRVLKEKRTPAEYITLTTWDCEGNERKQQLLFRPERVKVIVENVPELKPQ